MLLHRQKLLERWPRLQLKKLLPLELELKKLPPLLLRLELSEGRFGSSQGPHHRLILHYHL